MSIRHDPEKDTFRYDHFLVSPDNYHVIGLVLNSVLELLGSGKKAMSVTLEDAVVAWGIMNPQNALDMAKRLEIDKKKRKFRDPQQSRVSRKIKSSLGLIS